VLDTAVQAAGKWVFGNSPLVILTDIIQFVLGLFILSCAFAALLKYLPDGPVPWAGALVGCTIAAVLFSVGKKLFALYLSSPTAAKYSHINSICERAGCGRCCKNRPFRRAFTRDLKFMKYARTAGVQV
jgi:membrane protein